MAVRLRDGSPQGVEPTLYAEARGRGSAWFSFDDDKRGTIEMAASPISRCSPRTS